MQKILASESFRCSAIPSTCVAEHLSSELASFVRLGRPARLLTTRNRVSFRGSIDSRRYAGFSRSQPHRHTLTTLVSPRAVLSLFGRLANLPDVDPTAMQRHRRASSASSASESSGTGRSPEHYAFPRSRSSSRTGLAGSSGSLNRKRGSSSSISVSPGLPATTISTVSPSSAQIGRIPSLEGLQTHWAERVRGEGPHGEGKLDVDL